MRLYLRVSPWLLLLIFGGLFSCQSGPKVSDDNTAQTKGKPVPRPPKDYLPAEAKVLTAEGENWDAQFSPDGRFILYVSKGRVRHLHSQVYEFDRATLRHRRVTFHDGENASPRYDSSGKWILYASTTDEIKENPTYIQKALRDMSSSSLTNNADSPAALANTWLTQPFEIYRSAPNGSHIERLTRNAGYDAEASLHPSTPTIIFTSTRRGKPQLHLMNTDGSRPRRLTAESAAEAEGAFNVTGRELAFVRYSADLKLAHVVVKEAKTQVEKLITPQMSMSWSPVWHPDGDRLIFSSNLDDPENFELFVVKKDGSCLQRLTYAVGNDIQPAISPDGKQLVFTSDRSGARHLYLMEFKAPTTCPES